MRRPWSTRGCCAMGGKKKYVIADDEIDSRVSLYIVIDVLNTVFVV
jgi:hypothetical protein